MHQSLAVTARTNLRHNPLPNPGPDLPVSWIELSVIGDVHNLVAPVIHQEQARCSVSLAEAVKIAHRPPRTVPSLGMPGSRQIARRLSPSDILEQIASAISRV